MGSTITLTDGGCQVCSAGTYLDPMGVCLACPAGTTTPNQNMRGIGSCGTKTGGQYVSYRMEVNALVDIPANEYNADRVLAYMQAAAGEKGEATINDIKL